MNRKTVLALAIPLLIFLFSFSIRWFNLPNNLFFGFEQGRDAFIVRDIYTLKDFVLVGPKTDLDGIFHGPWYFYMIAVPYFISGGNPLAASAFLIALGSFIPVLLYYLLKDITRSMFWGIVAGIFGIVSYELIIFSRWLSNVSPAMLFVTCSFLALWIYRTRKKEVFFFLSVAFSAFAAQFEIILSLLLGFAYLVMLGTRLVRLPKMKMIVSSLLIFFFAFSPMLLFNIRNQGIISNSIVLYLSGKSEQHNTFHLSQSVITYAKQNIMLFRKTLMYTNDNLILLLTFSIFLFGIILYMRNGKKEREMIFFLCVWFFMSAPLLLFTNMTGTSQLYVGIAPSLIVLCTISLFALRKKGNAWFGILVFLLFFTANLKNITHSLQTNSDVFFKTIQDDLNYKDQRSILSWIHNDAGENPYQFTTYSIPYFHSEGWQYLRAYFYPQDDSTGAKTLYIVIEERVEPFWEKIWTEGYGNTTLLTEKKVGRIRVQKRTLQ